MAIGRRIVTGVDEHGLSCVVSDGIVAPGDISGTNFWRTDGTAPPMSLSGGAGPFAFVPPPGGSTFRIFALPPAPAVPDPAGLAAFAAALQAAIGIPGSEGRSRRHPLMHVTPTLDYVMLLSGRVELLLDQGDPVHLAPFDVVIQRGTAHAWLNTGAEPAVFLAVMTRADGSAAGA